MKTYTEQQPAHCEPHAVPDHAATALLLALGLVVCAWVKRLTK